MMLVSRVAFRVEVSLESGGTLINHGFEFIVVNVREGEVEDFAGVGDERWEEASKEDGV